MSTSWADMNDGVDAVEHARQLERRPIAHVSPVIGGCIVEARRNAVVGSGIEVIDDHHVVVEFDQFVDDVGSDERSGYG